MGIGRDSRHKHYKTGGRSKTSIKKRKYEMGRPATPCKLGAKRVRSVRCRGGNMKYRALRLDAGNYAWGSENVTKKVRILDVVYNATSNELVRTKTLLKNTVVQIDAHPFMQWYLKKYGVDMGEVSVPARKLDWAEVHSTPEVHWKVCCLGFHRTTEYVICMPNSKEMEKESTASKKDEQHSLTVECGSVSVKAATSDSSVAVGVVGIVCGTAIVIKAIEASTMKN